METRLKGVGAVYARRSERCNNKDGGDGKCRREKRERAVALWKEDKDKKHC